ncbi:hypothetical protein SH449x_002422 [Pirellulaceae bacterium SH449]
MMQVSLISEIYRIQGYDVERWHWGQLGTYLLAGLLIVFGLWQGLLAISRWSKKPSESPSKLLATLIRSHQLSTKETKLIQRMARNIPRNLPVASLFVDPLLWEDDRIYPKSTEKQELKHKLFGM